MSRILVVDDQKSIRELIREVLLDAGMKEVDAEADGDAALACLQNRSYSLLICDWHMPRMDGVTLLKAVRAQPDLANLPIIMLTGESARDRVIEVLKLGVTGFVKKPFDPNELVAAVQRALSGSEPA